MNANKVQSYKYLTSKLNETATLYIIVRAREHQVFRVFSFSPSTACLTLWDNRANTSKNQ